MNHDWAFAAVKLAALVLGAIALNLPLGYLRRSCARFSPCWYVCVHISVPVMMLFRLMASFSWKVVPLTLGGAVAGQVVGGLLNRRRNDHG